MPAPHGSKADFPAEKTGGASDDEFHTPRISLTAGIGKRGGLSLTLAKHDNCRIDYHYSWLLIQT